MEIKIDTKKSIFENINEIYKKIKELKRKKEKILDVIREKERELLDIDKNLEIRKKIVEKKKEKKWYEKFRWMYTSNNFLIIAGKDAITNEILIRKYLEKNDLVFHTDIHGSPFGILKNGQSAQEKDIKEAAKFVASYSRAWKLKLSSVDVYYVYPDQVSKKAPAGMYLKKGSFMIYGTKNYIKTNLELSIGMKDFEIIVSLPEIINNITKTYVNIIPGDIKVLEIAKKIGNIFKIDYNYILPYLPGESYISFISNQ